MSSPALRFTGIFIPIEILEMHEINAFDKIVLSWIDAMYCKEHGGCFASNEYLADRLNVEANTVAKILVKLRKLGLIEDVSFDGRKRVIRALINKYVENTQRNAALDSGPTPIGQPSNPGFANRPSTPYIDSKDDRKVDIGAKPPPPTPPIKKRKAEPSINFGTYVVLKDGEYEKLCGEMGKGHVEHFIAAIENYVPNRKAGPYKDYAAAIRQWYLRAKAEGKLPNLNKVNESTSPPAMGNDEETLREWWKVVKNKLKRPAIEETYYEAYEYIQFRNDDGDGKKIYFKDVKFKDLVKNELKNRNYIP